MHAPGSQAAVNVALLLSCYKALERSLEHRNNRPVPVLALLARLAQLCSGLGTLADAADAEWPNPVDVINAMTNKPVADNSAAAASSSFSDSSAQLVADGGQLLSKALAQFKECALAHVQPLNVTDRATSSSSSSSSSSSRRRATDVVGVACARVVLTLLGSNSSRSSAANVAAVVCQNGESLILLVGRALHVAASALSVRQLKALLAGLGVGCHAAAEKSDLVGALVAQLGLS
jgi:hypothetical protein